MLRPLAAWLAQKMQFAADGNEWSLYIPPPTPFDPKAELPTKLQLISFGEVDEELYMPPPSPIIAYASRAQFPTNAQLVRIGEQDEELYIPPPYPALVPPVAEFPVKTQLVSCGDDDS